MYIVCKHGLHTAEKVFIAHLGQQSDDGNLFTFTPSKGMPTVDPDNVIVPPQDPNRQQQQARETSPLAENNLFSQQFAKQLSPGINLFSQQFASQLSKLLHQFMLLAPS